LVGVASFDDHPLPLAGPCSSFLIMFLGDIPN
jgi:hypothetical protein